MTDTYWKPKTAAQIADDKNKSRDGTLTLFLLTGTQTEKDDIIELIHFMERSPKLRDIKCTPRCHRGLYSLQDDHSHSGQPPAIPFTGVLFRLEGFPVDALSEISFKHSLFTRDKDLNILIPWGYDYTGPEQLAVPTSPGGYTIGIYSEPPASGPLFYRLLVTGMTTIHHWINPKLKHLQSISTVTKQDEPVFEIDLTLTKQRAIHEKKIKDLEKEKKAYNDFIPRWVRFDKSNLETQKREAATLIQQTDQLRSKLQSFKQNSQASLEIGRELCRKLESRVDSINDDIQVLSGKGVKSEQLICVSPDNEAYHSMLLNCPLQMLKSIQFLPVFFKNPQKNDDPGHHCYLLRYNPSESIQEVFKHFINAMESNKEKSYITFRPDRRWFDSGIKVWLPEGYTLKPFFFSYHGEEQKLAHQHIREMVKSIWGEDSSQDEHIIQSTSQPGVWPKAEAELVFIPAMKQELGSQNWLSPGITMINSALFKPLSEGIRFLNAQQSVLHKEYFTNLYKEGSNVAITDFQNELLSQKYLDLKKNPQLMNYLVTQWTGLLNDDIQQILFDAFKKEVMETAETIIKEKTSETNDEVQKRLQRLEQERDKLLKKAKTRHVDLHARFERWNAFFDRTQQIIEGYREKTSQAQQDFENKWQAAKKRWDSLIKKARSMANLERQFKRTANKLNLLLGKMTLHFFIGSVLVSAIALIAYMFLKGGQQ